MEVYLATGNAHKLEEFRQMVEQGQLPVRLHSPDEIGGMPEVEETGTSLEENARIKGQALLARIPTGSWVLADDSGLLVDALDGAPGVHSARYAGPVSNAAANNIKLLHELHEVPMDKRTARFSCVLYFAREGGEHYFSGSCEGHILTVPSGHQGFGYDPLFQPLGYSLTFADLDSETKHQLSHRGRAVEAWTAFLASLES